MTTLMIYGAGYTGRLAVEYAKRLGLGFMLAGRLEGRIRDLASSLNVPYRIFGVLDPESIAMALQDVQVLLNLAGPFLRTSKPLIQACIRHGVHYLDTAAELDSYQLAEHWWERGHVVERMGNVSSIDVALHVAGSMSRGSAISAAENVTTKCLQRVAGELVQQDIGCTTQFDFDDGNGSVPCFPITTPDLITVWKSTGIPNMRMFVHVSGDAFSSGELDALPDGPTAEHRAAHPYHAVVTATGADGTVRSAALHTVNGYDFTALASVQAAKRAMDGEVRFGFQTPATVFGNGFVETIASSYIIDL